MSYTEAHAASIALAEELFVEFNLNSAEHRVPSEEGRVVYGLQRGSAQLYLILSCDEQSAWVQVISPILTLPEGKNQRACYEELLRLNSKGLVNCFFGIEDDRIVIGSDRTALDLQLSELRDMVVCVSTFADEFDDPIAERFGCKLASEIDA